MINEPINNNLKSASTRRYAVLQECDPETSESWLYFINADDNAEELAFLQEQLMSIKWYIFDDENSLFDLELDYLVSEQTAKEMTMIDLNPTSFHRKFDGKLKRIDFRFKSTDKNKHKMKIVNKLLGMGGIENFIDKEDVDLIDGAADNDDDSDTSSESSFSSSSSSDEEKVVKKPHKKQSTDVMKQKLQEAINSKKAERERSRKK